MKVKINHAKFNYAADCRKLLGDCSVRFAL